MGTQDIHGYTLYIGVYSVYSTTKVNIHGNTRYMGYIGYTVLLG